MLKLSHHLYELSMETDKSIDKRSGLHTKLGLDFTLALDVTILLEIILRKGYSLNLK